MLERGRKGARREQCREVGREKGRKGGSDGTKRGRGKSQGEPSQLRIMASRTALTYQQLVPEFCNISIKKTTRHALVFAGLGRAYVPSPCSGC